MKPQKTLALLLIVALLLPAALAHEHHTFTINGKTYEFIIGSLNEPIAVDDRTGVDLRVVHVDEEASHDDHVASGHSSSGGVTGLEQTLKVELIAGDKKKTIDLSPAYNNPGAYRAYFIPTVATTYVYRVFGTIDGTPVDLSFTCNPAGHPASPADNSTIEISEGVTRTFKSGSYGCPRPKEELGFPEAAPSLVSLSEQVGNPATPAATQTTPMATWAALGLGALGTILGIGAFMNGKKR